MDTIVFALLIISFYSAIIGFLIFCLEKNDKKLRHERKMVFHKAVDVFGDREKAEMWLFRVNPVFYPFSPYDYMSDQKRIEEVKTILCRIEHGIF